MKNIYCVSGQIYFKWNNPIQIVRRKYSINNSRIKYICHNQFTAYISFIANMFESWRVIRFKINSNNTNFCCCCCLAITTFPFCYNTCECVLRVHAMLYKSTARRAESMSCTRAIINKLAFSPTLCGAAALHCVCVCVQFGERAARMVALANIRAHAYGI